MLGFRVWGTKTVLTIPTLTCLVSGCGARRRLRSTSPWQVRQSHIRTLTWSMLGPCAPCFAWVKLNIQTWYPFIYRAGRRTVRLGMPPLYIIVWLFCMGQWGNIQTVGVTDGLNIQTWYPFSPAGPSIAHSNLARFTGSKITRHPTRDCDVFFCCSALRR